MVSGYGIRLQALFWTTKASENMLDMKTLTQFSSHFHSMLVGILSYVHKWIKNFLYIDLPNLQLFHYQFKSLKHLYFIDKRKEFLERARRPESEIIQFSLFYLCPFPLCCIGDTNTHTRIHTNARTHTHMLWCQHLVK